jgi:hypothetical protein
VRVAGRVITEDDTPVADAQVRLEPGPHTTTTGADGAFAIDGLAARTYAVTSRKGGLYAWHTLVSAERAQEPVTLRLRPGMRVVLHVVAEGAPVVGATVALEHGIRATSDASGDAVLDGLTPIAYEGRIMSDHWADQPFYVHAPTDACDVIERTITLHRGARIEGRVLDMNREPVGDAVVLGWNHDKGGAPYEAWSDRDGRWAFRAAAGAYRLYARASLHDSAEELRLACDGRTPHRELVLRVVPCRARPNERVAGVVLDEERRPAAEVDVRVVQRQFVRADTHGRFDVDGLPPGEHEIVADWLGPWQSPRDTAVRRRVRAGDTNIEVVLQTGSTVTGRALLEGEPLPYYGLRLVPERYSPYGGMPIPIRSADGRFTVPHVHPGLWQIAVMAPGTVLAMSEQFTITDREHVDVGDIHLTRGRRLGGYVRDASGAVVAGAHVTAGMLWWQTAERSPLERLFATYYETTTDERGAYTFDGIDVYHHPLRRIELASARAPGGASLVQLVPTTDATLDFVLIGTGRIEGVVENMHGGILSVLARRSDEPTPRTAHCDAAGRFELEDLPAGDYDVSVSAPEAERGASARVTVVANETVRIALAMQGTGVVLRVRVPADRGADLVIEPIGKGAEIRGRVRGIAHMHDEDTCHFEYVQPGRYRVSLDRTHWTTIVVKASPNEQEIDLRRPQRRIGWLRLARCH